MLIIDKWGLSILNLKVGVIAWIKKVYCQVFYVRFAKAKLIKFYTSGLWLGAVPLAKARFNRSLRWECAKQI